VSADLPRKSPTVVFKEMDQGGVLFCSRTEVYFGVNEVGRAIWNQLSDVGGSFEGLLDALLTMFPDVSREELAADVREFLNALKENELVAEGGSEENRL
jgi:Coenzyme PQQ synthesis protein D (PqqD)